MALFRCGGGGVEINPTLVCEDTVTYTIPSDGYYATMSNTYIGYRANITVTRNGTDVTSQCRLCENKGRSRFGVYLLQAGDVFVSTGSVPDNYAATFIKLT